MAHQDQSPPPPGMDYMIRLTQIHETFRLAELRALAHIENVKLEILSYSPIVTGPYMTKISQVLVY